MAENKIHPEMRARAVKELRALADRLEQGASPVVVIGYETEQQDEKVSLLMIGSNTDRQFRMISNLDFVLNACVLDPGTHEHFDDEASAGSSS